MEKILKSVGTLALVLVCLLGGTDSFGAVKPQWVRQGEEAMNKKRIGEGYTFKVFHSWNADLTLLRNRRFDRLKTYVREKYGADPMTMTLDSLVSVDSGEVTYRINFKDAGGDGVVYARQVDEYSYFDDFETNEFGFELYQLFAVSDKNFLPVFDEFVKKENDNTTAAALSIIPGIGQIYKGDNLKGFGLLGSEAVLAAGAIVSHIKYNDYQRNAESGMPAADSWHSKATSCKVARNILTGTFATVWVYNILDAAILPGGSRILVKKADGQKLTVAPSSAGVGVALTYRF